MIWELALALITRRVSIKVVPASTQTTSRQIQFALK
jgi:hypothetical protein